MARRGLPIALATLCVALGVFFALTSLDGDGGGVPATRAAAIAPAPLATYSVAAPHVLSSITLYPRTGGFQTPGAQEEPPRFASQFSRPIARYRAYAVAQLGAMGEQIARLENALGANDRGAGQSAWRAAYVRYLRVGAVYLDGETASLKEVASLNQQIDGSAGGLPGGASSSRFAGLHRIEYGLWTGAPPNTLLGLARRLDTAVRRLRNVLPHVPITPLEYATRAHEILEDAVRDLLSGADVPWSNEGVIATDAGLEADEEVISTLRPVFPRDSQVRRAVETEFAAVRSAIASITAAHDGRLPANAQLTQREAELLDGTVGGALEALSLVPGAVETEPLPQIPQIPQRNAVIDP